MADTLQQWADYIAEYETNMVEVRQRTETVLSNPQSTAQDKQNALEEQYRQEAHLRELKSQYATYSVLGEVPATVEFGGSSTKTPILFYKTNVSGDNAIHHGTVFPISGSGDLHLPDSEISLGTVFTSDLLSFSARLKNNGYTVGAYSDINLSPWREEVAGTSITWGFESDTAMSNGWVSTKFTPSGYTIILNDVSWTQNRTICPCVKGAYRSINDPITINQNYSFAAPITLALLSEIENPYGEVSGDSPWDYYNEELLPTVPDNPAFPDGYHPTNPDDPPDEPTDIPHDDGEPPDHQRDRAVGLPSQFITQYLLSYSQLQTFGLNLWQSWLTPNTDVWKNFFLPYAQDFGTLNVGACLDFIISLRVYPVDFADYLDLIGSSNGLYMGTGHTDFLGSSCAITKKLFHAFDCGTCEVKPEKPYNDYRDMYNTSVSVVLPYCGTVELTPSEVMYRNLRAYYYVDFQSGACTAVVEVEGDSGWYMVASKTGQMGFLLPITATNAGQLSAQFGKDATETLGTLAGFFFDVAGAIGQSAENVASILAFNKRQTDSSKEKDVPVGMTVTQSLKIGESGVNTGLALANQALNRLSRSGIDMPMLSGGGGTEALMFPDTPYVQIRRGKYAKPDNYPHSQGFLNGSSNTIEYYKGAFQGTPTIDPSYQGRGLCKFTGVDSTGLTCNNDERVEIITLLESGIYI